MARTRFSDMDEDAFLWDEAVPVNRRKVRPIPLSEAEKLAIRLAIDVTLQSAFALEDPNERYNQLFGHLHQVTNPPRAPEGREVASQDISNHLYEVTLEDGVVGFEVNPPDAPALARTVLIGGRVDLVLEKVFLAFERAILFEAHELSPLRMTHTEEAETGGNRFFRLVSDPARNIAHDVACLLAWIRLESGAQMLEITAWPVEKTD